MVVSVRLALVLVPLRLYQIDSGIVLLIYLAERAKRMSEDSLESNFKFVNILLIVIKDL